MFSKVLYQNLKANLGTIGAESVQWGFGSVKSDAKAPYIVFYELDDDQDPQLLCDEQGDSGDYLLQLNIYSPSFIKNNAIKKEVSKYLQTLQGTNLTDGADTYTIDIVNHSSSLSADSLVADLAVDVLAKTINYTKIN